MAQKMHISWGQGEEPCNDKHETGQGWSRSSSIEPMEAKEQTIDESTWVAMTTK